MRKLVYIVTTGRSGSTLLGRLLDADDRFLYVGEVAQAFRAFAERHACSCGRPVLECDLWSRVIAALRTHGIAEEHWAGLASATAAFHRHRNVAGLLGGSRSARAARRFEEYRTMHRPLLDAVFACAGERVVVDTSHYLTRALALSGMPGVEVSTIHLVRDGRGVAHSWTKTKRSLLTLDGEKSMPRTSAASAAFNWAYVHGWIEVAKSTGHRYRVVRLEDLVADPNTVLNQLAVDAGVAPPLRVSISGRTATLGPHHGLLGNPMRFVRGPIELVVDEEWRTALSPWQRLACTALEAPLLWRYGYVT